jgi:hypothetical protein
MLRFAQALFTVGMLWFVSGCCSMCQSPFDYSGPVRSGAVTSAAPGARVASAVSGENYVGLPPSSPTPVVEQASTQITAPPVR